VEASSYVASIMNHCFIPTVFVPFSISEVSVTFCSQSLPFCGKNFLFFSVYSSCIHTEAALISDYLLYTFYSMQSCSSIFSHSRQLEMLIFTALQTHVISCI